MEAKKRKKILYEFQITETRTKTNIAVVAVLGVTNLVLAIYFGASQNFLGSFIFLAASAMIAFSVFKKGAGSIRCRIREGGIQLNSTLYPYKYLKSFWIFSSLPYQAELSIKSKKWLTGNIRIPLGDENPAKIRKLLSEFMPERKQKQHLSDIFARIIGL